MHYQCLLIDVTATSSIQRRPVLETFFGFCCPWKNALYKVWKSQLFFCACPQHPLLQEGRLVELQTVHILIQGIWLPGILFYKKPAKDRLVIRTSCLRHDGPALREAGGLVDSVREQMDRVQDQSGESIASVWLEEGGWGERWVQASDTKLRGYEQEALMSLPVHFNRGHEMSTAAVGL